MTGDLIITAKMRAVNQVLIDRCPGMNHCISELGRNTIVEVPKEDCAIAVSVLKERFEDVVNIRKAYAMIEDLHDYILVKPMITEAPLFTAEGIPVPSDEKHIVDLFADREYVSVNREKKIVTAQRAFELKGINISKLLRYAGRKGKKEEMSLVLSSLDHKRKDIIDSLRHVLSAAPVSRAWMFGSFSRMEERADSDLDVLVELSETIGLLAYASLINRLESATGRKVDLVAKDSLKPFAVDSVEQDKVLIYERTSA